MNSVNVTITQLVQDSYSVDSERQWLRFRMSSGRFIAFWGALGAANRNIVSLRHQVLPCCIELLEPEECGPSDYEKAKYGLCWSVPLDAAIAIDPEY